MRRLSSPGSPGLHDKSFGEWKAHPGPREWKQVTAGFKAITGKRIVPVIILLICTFSLLHRMRDQERLSTSQIPVTKLWSSGHSTDWRASCAPRSSDWDPPRGSNGYLLVRCNGGLNQQRIAICNAVLAARIMNATLVLPQLDTNSFWHDESGFPDIYDAEHFIDSLKKDVRVIQTLPATWKVGSKKLKLRPFQLNPPRDAPVSWYETTALEKMKKHGVVKLTPFSHRLDEKLDSHEYQRLRCRVNYHALRFNNDIRNVSSTIVERLRLGGPYIAVHLRFELDMLAFAGCLDIFTPEEQEMLKEYRKKNFAEKKLEYTHRRLIGKCPLTPVEVGLFLQAIGFDNSTRIYLAIGEVFGGEKFLKPLRDLFPLLETRSTVALPDELALGSGDARGLLGPAVDYMVCLLSDIFVPTYEGPSNFANNLIGQRLYYGFRTTLQPDRRALAPLFIDLEKGRLTRSDFEISVRQILNSKSSATPHTRVSRESFYTNPWPECFCKNSTKERIHKCPLDTVESGGLDTDDADNFVND